MIYLIDMGEKGQRGKKSEIAISSMLGKMNDLTSPDPGVVPSSRQRILHAANQLPVSPSTLYRRITEANPGNTVRKRGPHSAKTNDELLASEYDAIPVPEGKRLTPRAKIEILNSMHPSLTSETIRRSLQRTGRVEVKKGRDSKERKGEKSIYLDNEKVREMFLTFPITEGEEISNRQKVVAIANRLETSVSSVYRSLYDSQTLIPDPNRRKNRE